MKNFTPCLFACCLLFAAPVFSQVSIDGSFGNNGKVTTAYPIAESEIYKVHTLADGKILTCSIWYQQGISYPAVVRYLSNGLIDEAFGANGIARISMTAEYPEPVAMFVQDDGKILVAGTHEIVRNAGNFAIQCLNADGSFDNAFGANSVVITNFGGYNGARDILVQPDHKILVSGVSNATPAGYLGENYTIARYNPDGSIDNTFGVDGKSIVDFSTDTSTASESADKMKLQSDGKIMIAGYSKTASHKNFSMIKLNANGSLDTTFGNLGQFVLNYGVTEEDKFRSLAITPDNKYIAAGSSYNQENGHSKMVFVKLNADGSYDTSFGTNGISAIQISNSFQDDISEIALQENGKILACGSSMNENIDYLLMRLNADGSLDTNFNATGYFRDALVPNDAAYAMEVQNNGRVILAGATITDGNFKASLSRFIIDGNLSAINSKANHFLVYPNPVSGILNIENTDGAPIKTIAIYNMSGQLVLNNLTGKIDVSNMKPGNYFVKIETENESQIVKFVKR